MRESECSLQQCIFCKPRLAPRFSGKLSGKQDYCKAVRVLSICTTLLQGYMWSHAHTLSHMQIRGSGVLGNFSCHIGRGCSSIWGFESDYRMRNGHDRVFAVFKLLVEGRIYLLCGLFLSFPRNFVVFSSFSEPYHAAVWAVRNLESRVSNAGSTQYGSICHPEHPTHLPRFGMVGMRIGHMETSPILFSSLSQFIAQLLSTYFESIQERFSLH